MDVTIVSTVPPSMVVPSTSTVAMAVFKPSPVYVLSKLPSGSVMVWVPPTSRVICSVMLAVESISARATTEKWGTEAV